MVDPTTKPSSLGFRRDFEWMRWLLSGLIAFLDETEMNKEWMKSSFGKFTLIAFINWHQWRADNGIYCLLFTAYWLTWADVCCHEYFWLPLRVTFTYLVSPKP
jgi:hypothetical protein